MRREIDRYFSEYLTTIKKTKEDINDRNTIVMELGEETINSIIKKEKRVFASCIYTYDSFFKTMPVENAYTIVTHKSRPKCIIKTTKVETVEFKNISENNIKNDLSYKDVDLWKSNHIGIFEHECRDALRVFNPSVPIVIETFELVYA